MHINIHCMRYAVSKLYAYTCKVKEVIKNWNPLKTFGTLHLSMYLSILVCNVHECMCVCACVRARVSVSVYSGSA